MTSLTADEFVRLLRAVRRAAIPVPEFILLPPDMVEDLRYLDGDRRLGRLRKPRPPANRHERRAAARRGR